VNQLYDLRVAVSREVADSIIDVEYVPREKVVVVENGIDVDRALGVDGGAVRRELGLGTRPVIACVSRLSEEKGVASAIRMMPRVGREAVLLLVGDGPDEAAFRRLAGELDVGDRVRFLGLRDDVHAAADVAVVPSHCEEAFGLAMAEGMAAGRAVVVSSSGAMPALIGDAGCVVPKKDPEALAAAVSRLLEDPELRERLGRAAQLRARNRFGMTRYVDEVCDLYRGRRLSPSQSLAA
jgi:glycosyltransferase involved in cell wall biosynthesis